MLVYESITRSFRLRHNALHFITEAGTDYAIFARARGGLLTARRHQLTPAQTERLITRVNILDNASRFTFYSNGWSIR